MVTSVTISAGYTLSNTTLLSGGMAVGSVSLSPGETLIVASGGTAEALTVSGETIRVSNGGTTSGLVIGGGGSEVLSAGASATGTTVSSGGSVSALGTNTDTGLSVTSGGLLDIIGTITSQTSPVSVTSGAQIEFGGAATNVSGTTIPVISSNTGSTTTLTVSASGLAHQSVVLTGSGQQYITSTVGSGTTARYVLTLTTCFAGGTQIRTATGEVPIEAIQPGDMVGVLRDGAVVQEPVVWVGRSRINLARHAQVELAAPIRVKAGALADYTPTRDLLLSPEHCLILDGLCIPVKLLINGGSIVREYPNEPFEYFHIELERHGILLAEGAAAESYLDTGNRSSFDNAEVPRKLHPTFAVNATAERWKTEACAPLAVVPDDVVPVWQGLAERAVALGHTIQIPPMVADADLHILADGQRVQPIAEAKSRVVFMVPAGTRSVVLASRYCIPADRMIANLRDTRRLGVSVDAIAIRSVDQETILPADHPALQDGWNAVERHGARTWRWTNGAATIPWDNVAGPAVVTVRCTPADQYPVQDGIQALVA